MGITLGVSAPCKAELCKSHQQLQYVIVSDIFGRTTALERLALQLSEHTVIHDPYFGKDMAFRSEDQAYAYFSEHVTLDGYVAQIHSRIQDMDKPLCLVGFSAGASAIWQLSACFSAHTVSGAFGFYGSQIRHAAEIEPRFPVTLTFPKYETHFSVSELMERLTVKANVTLRQVPYLHGFMNPHSINYNQQGYQSELSVLRDGLAAAGM